MDNVRGRCPLLLALMGLLCSGFAGMGAVRDSGRVHPQDGPHADFKIEIDESSLRFDIVMNLVFLDGLTDIYREVPSQIHPIEEEGVSRAILDHFRGEGPIEAVEQGVVGRVRSVPHVTIDGVEVTPTMGHFESVNPGMDLLPLFPVTGMRGVNRVHVVLEYPVKSMPETVSIVWGAFPLDEVGAVDGSTPTLEIEAQLTAEGLFSVVRFSATEPEFIWHATGLTADERFLPIPEAGEPPAKRSPTLAFVLVGGAVVLAVLALGARSKRGIRVVSAGGSLVAAAAAVVAFVFVGSTGDGLPTEEHALAIFEPLHANIYRAFDYEDESDVYDALARSVTGDLLESLYDEIYRSLVMIEEGGAVSRIQKVTPVESQVTSVGRLPDGQTAFDVIARWRVLGVVYHWGHSHTRLNEYQAQYVVVEETEGWRIAGSKTLEQFRVDSAPGETLDGSATSETPARSKP